MSNVNTASAGRKKKGILKDLAVTTFGIDGRDKVQFPPQIGNQVLSVKGTEFIDIPYDEEKGRGVLAKKSKDSDERGE